MKIYLSTFYFDRVVVVKRPYVTLEICIQVVENPIFMLNQHDGRIRFWGMYQNKFLRVITLGDGLTIHNAFFDRNFDLKKRGLQ
jgi:hypothetical protein